jgi:hypothetical protein
MFGGEVGFYARSGVLKFFARSQKRYCDGDGDERGDGKDEVGKELALFIVIVVGAGHV